MSKYTCCFELGREMKGSESIDIYAVWAYHIYLRIAYMFIILWTIDDVTSNNC